MGEKGKNRRVRQPCIGPFAHSRQARRAQGSRGPMHNAETAAGGLLSPKTTKSEFRLTSTIGPEHWFRTAWHTSGRDHETGQSAAMCIRPWHRAYQCPATPVKTIDVGLSSAIDQRRPSAPFNASHPMTLIPPPRLPVADGTEDAEQGHRQGDDAVQPAETVGPVIVIPAITKTD